MRFIMQYDLRSLLSFISLSSVIEYMRHKSGAIDWQDVMEDILAEVNDAGWLYAMLLVSSSNIVNDIIEYDANATVSSAFCARKASVV